MTDDTQLAPTDAEIDVIVYEHTGFDGDGTQPMTADEMRRVSRAVLTRWGQPAHSGEPVAWLDPWTGAKATTDYDAYGKHGIPLYTAPPPVEREPTPEAQVFAALRGVNSLDALAVWRAAEAAHGITQKGGRDA